MIKETKEVGRELRSGKGILSQEGSLRKREVSKHQETLTMVSLGSTEGNITGKKNKTNRL